MSATFLRSFAVEDIHIRSGGDGRTVVAYAAVFNRPTSIEDGQGHYREQIAPTAFNKTIADRGTDFGVFFNHAKTLYGTPSELGAVPIGRPVEAPKADRRGLLTVSRYNKSALADAALEAIRSGDITGQSFSGRWVNYAPSLPRGGFRAGPDGSLQLVTRSEIAMQEYGPTPIPAYEEPMMLAVRSQAVSSGLRRVRDHFARATLNPGETQALTFLLAQLAGADAAFDPIVDALCATDCALDQAQLIVSAMLAVPDPDSEDMGEMDPQTDTTPAMASGRRPAPATVRAATEEPRTHSGRLTPATRARIGTILRGI